MNTQTKWILAVSFTLAAVGFLLPFWPLSVAGVLITAISGRMVFAIAIGLLLDVAYGAPAGMAAYLYLPFTLIAVAGIVGRYLAMRYVRSTPTERL